MACFHRAKPYVALCLPPYLSFVNPGQAILAVAGVLTWSLNPWVDGAGWTIYAQDIDWSHGTHHILEA